MKISKFITAIQFLLIICFSCNQKDPQEYQLRDSTYLEDYKNYDQWDVSYKEDTFLVLSDWKTKIKIYQNNQKISEIISQDLIKTEFGFKLSGELPVGFFSLGDSLYLLQTNPYQIRKINYSKSSLGAPERLRIPDYHYFVGFIIESDDSLILISSDDKKRVYFYRYNLDNKTLNNFYLSSVVIGPHSTLVKIFDGDFYVLFPYEKIFQVVSTGGKLLETFSLPKNPHFDLTFKDLADGLSPQEFMSMPVQTKLSMLKNEVKDFYFYQDNLFTINKIYDEVKLDKLSFDFKLMAYNVKNKKYSKFDSNKIPFKFDQKGNIFSLDIADKSVLEISPIKEFQ